MMQLHIVSLFPDYFDGPFRSGPVRKAQEMGSLAIKFVNPRGFTTDRYRTVDDYPFGGGAGMVMKPEPLFRAVESIRTPDSFVILLTPQGEVLNQRLVEELTGRRHLVLLCGRYKGIDERIRSIVDLELSIGDYILAGGEAAAIVLIEAVARLMPGAVGDEESVNTDTFSSGIFDAPCYTRPRVFMGQSVPEPLLSGDHQTIARWRRERALQITARRRPELLQTQVLTEREREALTSEIERERQHG